jgi:hypothetical protein
MTAAPHFILAKILPGGAAGGGAGSPPSAVTTP